MLLATLVGQVPNSRFWASPPRRTTAWGDVPRTAGGPLLAHVTKICAALERVGPTEQVYFAARGQRAAEGIGHGRGHSPALDGPTTVSGVQSIVLVVARAVEGVELLYEFDIRPERIQVRLAGVPSELSVIPGECGQSYRDRVIDFVRRADEPQNSLWRVGVEVERLERALNEAIPTLVWRSAGPIAELICPAADQFERFRNLRWEGAVIARHYRALPNTRLRGAYANPLSVYVDDPYSDLTHWIVVEELLTSGEWVDPRVRVVAPTGRVLFSADDRLARSTMALDIGVGRVSFGPRTLSVTPPPTPRPRAHA